MNAAFAIRAAAITFSGDPFLQPAASTLVHHADALIVIEQGRIVRFGAAAELLPALSPDIAVTHYRDAIVSAGFIDTHIHFPQTQMIAAYGEKLLEWLDKYTFRIEQQFAERAHADAVAKLFLRELLRAGTTTAAVYCTVHPQSVDALFEESARFNTRMLAGKVLMDRNAPAALLDTAQRGYDESKALIERWHGNGRQLYAITPRFAASSTEAQLDMAGVLWREHPGTYLQTHIAENRDEVAWVRELYPQRGSYLDIYDHAGLVGARTVLAHGIHLDETDFCTCHRTGAALAHCPTSNLFLGSGLFRLFEAKNSERPVRVGLGSDIGAGTSFSPLQSLNEAYKIAQLNSTKLNAIQAFYLATKGGAEALYLDDRIGSIAPGMEADLVVLDLKATPLLDFRLAQCEDVVEQLFVLMTLGDDRAVKATYVAGERVYERERAEPFCYVA